MVLILQKRSQALPGFFMSGYYLRVSKSSLENFFECNDLFGIKIIYITE